MGVLAVPLNAVTTREKNSDKTPGDKKGEKPASDATVKSVSAGDNTQEVVFVLQKDNTVKKIPVKTSIQDLNY
ncbi:hypothetical protein LAM21_24655, partial [Mycobacterium tuberculosis]|nr:hypothetical protein [Mycobacterium tuberculosis]